MKIVTACKLYAVQDIENALGEIQVQGDGGSLQGASKNLDVPA